MNQRSYELVIILLLAVIYWQAFSFFFDVHEPWDAPIYWVAAYPTSIVLSAFAGWLFRNLGWAAGLVITFAQLPILFENNKLEPIILFAIAILAALSVLPVTSAALAARFSRKS